MSPTTNIGDDFKTIAYYTTLKMKLFHKNYIN